MRQLSRKMRKIVSLVLVVSFVLALPIAVQASNDTLLVTVNVGHIYEVRNLSNGDLRLTLERGANTFTDHVIYRGDGNMANYQRGGWVGGGTVTQSNVTLAAGGKLVIQNRTGGNVTIRGNADSVQVTRLVTPVFYVREISYGVTHTFTNFSLNRHSIDWGGGTTNRYNNNSGELFGLVNATRINASGVETEIQANNLTGGVVGVEAGDSVRITGNFGGRPAGWSREIFGTHSAFSGQRYRLTIDGQRSYPPGTTATQPQPTPSPTPGQAVAMFSVSVWGILALLGWTWHNILMPL